jgi:hypothetical protein
MLPRDWGVFVVRLVAIITSLRSGGGRRVSSGGGGLDIMQEGLAAVCGGTSTHHPTTSATTRLLRTALSCSSLALDRSRLTFCGAWFLTYSTHARIHTHTRSGHLVLTFGIRRQTASRDRERPNQPNQPTDQPSSQTANKRNRRTLPTFLVLARRPAGCLVVLAPQRRSWNYEQ